MGRSVRWVQSTVMLQQAEAAGTSWNLQAALQVAGLTLDVPQADIAATNWKIKLAANHAGLKADVRVDAPAHEGLITGKIEQPFGAAPASLHGTVGPVSFNVRPNRPMQGGRGGAERLFDFDCDQSLMSRCINPHIGLETRMVGCQFNFPIGRRYISLGDIQGQAGDLESGLKVPGWSGGLLLLQRRSAVNPAHRAAPGLQGWNQNIDRRWTGLAMACGQIALDGQRLRPVGELPVVPQGPLTDLFYHEKRGWQDHDAGTGTDHLDGATKSCQQASLANSCSVTRFESSPSTLHSPSALQPAHDPFLPP